MQSMNWGEISVQHKPTVTKHFDFGKEKKKIRVKEQVFPSLIKVSGRSSNPIYLGTASQASTVAAEPGVVFKLTLKFY